MSKTKIRMLLEMEVRDDTPLEPDFQAEMGIINHLEKAGGRMSARALYHRRRQRREGDGWWFVAMRQLTENGYVRVTGIGIRNNPIMVELVMPPPIAAAGQSAGQ